MKLAFGATWALASSRPPLSPGRFLGRDTARVHRPPTRGCAIMAAAPMESALILRGGAYAAAGGGLTAAIISPAATALGFMLWDSNWQGSAFSLNLVKNAVASVFFALALCLTGALTPVVTPAVVLPVLSPLALSALLGVVVGDCTAIASLRLLGARRYLLVDCLKPALASAIGKAIGIGFMGEQASPRLVAGVAAVIVGVYVASSADSPAQDQGQRDGGGVAAGYALAVAHLILDTVGASLTKRCSGGLGPLQIGLVRFGAAAIMLNAISLTARVASIGGKGVKPAGGVVRKSASAWWRPVPPGMTATNWRRIIGGTFFVTFMAPALYFKSLLLLPFGVAATLSCTAPLYEPALARVLKGTKPNARAVGGAVLAFLGVAVLGLE